MPSSADSADSSSMHLPPGPDTPFSAGNDRESYDFLMSLQRDYGEIASFARAKGKRAFFVNDPDAIHSILVRHQKSYIKGPEFARVKLLLGNGLFVSEGATWRRARKMIQPSFGKQDLHQLIDVIVNCCKAKEERWQDSMAADEPVNVTREMNEFALEVILRAIFGSDYDTHIVPAEENPFSFLSFDSARDLNMVLKLRSLREFVLEVIDRRRRAPDTETFDFLSGLIRARDKEGNAFTDRELLDEVMTLVVAGFETSAGTLNWAWYLLAKNPDAEARILEEVTDKMPHAEPVTGERVAVLGFLQQCLNETMRLYPPGWVFARQAAEDGKLGEFDVAVGTDIFVSPYILHRTGKYWPDPGIFRPERFAIEQKDKDKRSAFIPFSLGARRCIGEYMAMMEMKIHLGLLLQEFRLTPVEDSEPELDFGINLRSLKDIYMNVSSR